MGKALVIATMTGRIIRPTAWSYDRVLHAEARRLGITPIPRVNEFNEPWRRHLEQQIGRALMMEKLFRRKPGQRGPGKQHVDGESETGQKILAQRREAYREKQRNPYRAR
jgi:hypothetical protein